MPECDLVLLHAPSVYDFRQEAILYGPVADFVPVPFAFEVYPLGYTGLVEYLERGGYRVCTMNLAAHMLDNPQFDAEAAIAAVNPLAFVIDFHWLAHAQGALAVAQIVKTFHPETPVILEGFAATYYHLELMDYPQVDYVLRGDSIEDALLYLMECLSLGRVPDRVAGLTWRSRSGRVVENLPGAPSASLDNLTFGYESWQRPLSQREAILNEARSLPEARAERLTGSGDLLAVHPEEDIIALGLMARGCAQNCTTCGTSAYAYRQLHGRQTPGYRSPELLARDLCDLRRYHTGPVYVPGDITQAGMDYAYRFLHAMYGFSALIVLDLFGPVPRKFLQDVADALPHFALQISMDSHDAEVRQAMGKSYSNQAIEQTIADALSLGCERIDLRFAIGLPHQNYDSVLATAAYVDDLLARFASRGIVNSADRLQPFIAPLAPFLDPGSIAFGEPEPAGYRLLFRSLEEHRRALLAPSWKYALNYETRWMTRDDIVRATYDATLALTNLRLKHGLVSSDYAQKVEQKVDRAYRLMTEIDRALALDDTDRFQETLRALKPEIDEVNRASLWDGHAAAKGVVTWRPDGPGRGQSGKMWRAFKDWWRRWSD
jgi:B12-binding domain/radical SAM domain protein